jgi:hypothetical protein
MAECSEGVTWGAGAVHDDLGTAARGLRTSRREGGGGVSNQTKRQKMSGLFKAKLSRDRSLGFKYHGGMGHRGPLKWTELVELISECGVSKVQYVQHFDKEPRNYARLNGGDMLRLWKAVAGNRK